MTMESATFDDTNGWVRETRIGTWFLGTIMWRQHVLPGTMDDLQTLLGGKRRFARLLDVACGQGFAFPFLDDRFQPDHLLGVDIDPVLVERSSAIADGCKCQVEVRVGNAAKLDLQDQSIDAVFCHQSFHHLEDQEAAAREFFRVLAPGGVLLFTESCRSFIYSWWVRLFFRHPMEVQKTAEEYVDLLQAVGFTIGRDDWQKPYPPWSRPDFGVLELLGRVPRQPHREPLVCVIARRPE